MGTILWLCSVGGFLSLQISTIVRTTPHARMGQHAPTVGSGATLALVAQATLVWTVS